MKPDTVQLGHGGGGRLSRELINMAVVSRFGDGPLRGLPDAATLSANSGEVVFSTDSFVVSPLEFPGGNIGHLAVHGSINDVAVAGGWPRWLSLALILEEGLPFAVLDRVLDAVRDAAAKADVVVATGDTKVVERGKCDGLYINTACIGERVEDWRLDAAAVRPGDVILISGTLGDHGMAIMAARNGMAAGGPVSDCASVYPFVDAALPYAAEVRFMRDPTRGGVAAVLNEMVEGATSAGIEIDETCLPLAPGTQAVADMLGLDPLYAACEGRVLLVCAAGAADAILGAWSKLPGGAQAARLGHVSAEAPLAGLVAALTVTGGRRIVDLPGGEILPRIC